MLKPILGYFCTLDPLGYAASQIDVLFMVLGTMIARLPKTPGEHQLRLIFAFTRTCRSVAEEFGRMDAIGAAVRGFIESAAFRTKEQIPNLLLLLGYALVLSPSFWKTHVPEAPLWNRFWTAYFEEAIRRNASDIFGDMEEFAVFGFLDGLVHGSYGPELPVDNTELRTKLSTVPKVPDKRENLPPLGNFYFHVPESASETLPEYSADKCTPAILERVLRFEAHLNAVGYPTTQAIIRLIIFMQQWTALHSEENRPGGTAVDVTSSADVDGATELVRLDVNSGIAPEHWVDGFKTAFAAAPDEPTFATLWRICQTGGAPSPDPDDGDGDDDGDSDDKKKREKKKKGKGYYESDEFYSDCLKALRGLIAQGVWYRSNKMARHAIENGAYQNSAEEPDAVLKRMSEALNGRRQSEARKKRVSSRVTAAQQRLSRCRGWNPRVASRPAAFALSLERASLLSDCQGVVFVRMEPLL